MRGERDRKTPEKQRSEKPELQVEYQEMRRKNKCISSCWYSKSRTAKQTEVQHRLNYLDNDLEASFLPDAPDLKFKYLSEM